MVAGLSLWAYASMKSLRSPRIPALVSHYVCSCVGCRRSALAVIKCHVLSHSALSPGPSTNPAQEVQTDCFTAVPLTDEFSLDGIVQTAP